MIVYYSGFGCTISNPEVCLGDRANLMLSFADSKGRKDGPHPRLAAVLAARERREAAVEQQSNKERSR